MKSDNANSGARSATTSNSGPSSSGQSPGPGVTPLPGSEQAREAAAKKAAKFTEADYLTQQAADAKAALQAALKDVAAKLGEGANPIEWARLYPWATVGASAVAGFVAASMLIPSKEQQALAKLAAIERALNPPAPKPKHVDSGVDADPNAKNYRAPTGFLGILAREAIGAVKPVLISVLTAQAAKPSQADMEMAAESADAKEATGQEVGQA